MPAPEKTRTIQAQERGLIPKRSTTTEETLQPLLTASAIKHLRRNKVLLFAGNAPPCILTQARYYRYKPWKYRAGRIETVA